MNLARMAPPSQVQAAPGHSALFDGLLRHAPTWDDIAWLQAQTQLPVLLKGVLHPEDARLALAQGVAGLIVSNHGGRTLDTAVSTARALPRMADAVGGALSGQRRRRRRGPCAALAARRTRSLHGAERLRHAGRHIARVTRFASLSRWLTDQRKDTK